jgi:hypothetical protein
VRKGLWKIERSELTPEELAWVREVDAEKARKRRRLKGGLINLQRREKYNGDQDCREKILRKNHLWRKQNFAKVYARRKETGEARRVAKKWYHGRGKFNLQHVLRERLRGRLRKAVRAVGTYPTESARKLCGCTIPELMLHLQSQFKEGMHWNNYGKWHIDHIRPCASFDLTDPEQQRQCFHYTNLQPLWARENIQKGARLITT